MMSDPAIQQHMQAAAAVSTSFDPIYYQLRKTHTIDEFEAVLAGKPLFQQPNRRSPGLRSRPVSSDYVPIAAPHHPSIQAVPGQDRKARVATDDCDGRPKADR